MRPTHTNPQPPPQDITKPYYDGAKKINGRKRHLVVDTLGLLLMILVTPADAGDRTTAAAILPTLKTKFRLLQRIWADSGYTGDLITWARTELALILEIVKRTDDLSGFRVVPRRWVAERTFGWLMRSRRLARDYETRTDSAQAMILWSMTMVMSRRLARRRTQDVTPRTGAAAAARTGSRTRQPPASPAPPAASPSAAGSPSPP